MRQTLSQASRVCLLALLAAGVVAWVHPHCLPWTPPPRAPGEVPQAEISIWPEPIVWLDARSRTHYEHRHIPQALLLNEDEWELLLPAVIEAWNPECRVVVYCGKESCRPSHEVAARLKKELQWSEVYVLEGGWDAWRQTHPK